MQEEESNIERKEKGESLSGGESSAEYIISKSEGESQLPDRAKKVSPSTDTKNPTVESANVERKERGESLSGGESSAEYMASLSGEKETDTETMADKIKAGAKAPKNKAEDTSKNLRMNKIRTR